MKCTKTLLVWLLSLSLLVTSVTPVPAIAATAKNSDYVKSGTYSYTSNENNNIQQTDKYTYRDDCFTQSSYIGCCHLAELSAQVAIASASRYGKDPDPYEIDPSNNAENLVAMLKDMGFARVSTNKYYTLEKLKNSAGVAVGHRTIIEDGKEYTLLAIIPRSAGYKQEWDGNFTVDDGDIHAGFKAARDEALRFTKQYIEDNGIKGNIKVWTVGHSRGSAIANMIGGFFAGGGFDYFDGRVSVTPEDVYCYCYAVPATIKKGLDKNVELSVAAARGGQYHNDTPGTAFTYTKGGTVDPAAEIYNGIRYYTPGYDVITLLPPVAWGFTYYGQEKKLDGNGCVDTDDMLKELKTISPYAYERFIDGGNNLDYSPKTFDLAALDFAEDKDSKLPSTMDGFLAERIEGLISRAKTNEKYVSDGYQDTLRAIAGIYGMGLVYLNEDGNIKTDEIIRPLIYTYLAFASERLQEEGTAQTESEAVAIALAELIGHYSGEELDGKTCSLDDAVYQLLKIIADNPDSKLHKTLIDLIVSNIPEDSKPLVTGLFAIFVPGYDPEGEDLPDLDVALTEYIRACVYGPKPEAPATDYDYDADTSRIVVLYQLILPYATSGVVDNITEITGESGEKPLKEVIEALKPLYMQVKDDQGTVIKDYDSFAEAADDQLATAVDSIMTDLVNRSKDMYGEDYYIDFKGHVDGLKANITKARTLVTYMLFYNDGENYSAVSNLKNAATFIGNIDPIPLAHYNEVYIAWMRALQNSDCAGCVRSHSKGNDDDKPTPTDNNITNNTGDDDYMNSRTGDDRAMILFAVLLILSILTLSVLALKRRLCPKDVSDQEIETS